MSLRNQVMNLIARAVVSLVSDETRTQLMQLGILDTGPDDDDAETIEDGERIQQYGVSSVPLPGAEAVVLFPGGDRSHPLIVAVDDRRYRPTGRPQGEVTIYTDEGDEIHLARGHQITIKTTGQVVIDAPSIKLGGSMLTALQGVVQGEGVEPVTGLTYAALGSASAVVMAKKA